MSRRASRPAARGLLAAVLVVGGLVGCGGREARPPIVVEVVPFASDGEVPREGWRLKGEDAQEVPLATSGEAGPHRGLLFRADAPGGRWALIGPAPWSLVGGPVLVAMQPGTPPTALGVGRAHTLYLLPPEGRTVGKVVLRAAGQGTDASAPVPTTRADGADGRVALRISSDRWSAAVTVHAALGDDTFARLDRVSLPKDGICTSLPLEVGPTLPVRVTVFPAAEAKGRLVLVADGEEFSIRREAPLDAQGGVTFDAFPETSHPVRFAIGAEPGAQVVTWTMPGTDAARGDLRLAWFDGRSAAVTMLKVEGGPVARGAVTVQLRRPGWPSYAVVPDVHVPDGGTHLVLPPLKGTWRLLVVTPEHVGVLASADETEGPLVLTKPCRVQAAVDGDVPRGRRFELECVRVEDDVEATAQGWYDRLVGRADLELFLPAGRYRLRLREGARVAPWTDLTLEQPSTRASIRLASPR